MNIQELMKQAQQMQERMQKQLAETQVEATAGGGCRAALLAPRLNRGYPRPASSSAGRPSRPRPLPACHGRQIPCQGEQHREVRRQGVGAAREKKVR